MLSNKQHAVELLDQLAPGQLDAVVHLLEAMLDGDDTLGPSERKAVAEAEEWLKHNEPIPHEQVLAELGLSREDWERMCNEPLPGEMRS
jgi:hypothetical protein